MAKSLLRDESQSERITGETSAIVDAARSVWNGKAGTSINIQRGSDTGAGAANDPTNVIVFNTTPPSGTIGWTDIYGGGTHSFKSQTFTSMSGADIRLSSTVPASNLTTLLAHEMGHALGFRHSNNNEGEPSANVAVMQISQSARPSSLQDWDILAASTVYSANAICPTNFISNQPQSRSIILGDSTRLTVSTVSDEIDPTTYQWYRGNSGDTSNLIAGATTRSVDASPTTTTSYWVRVTNGCGNDQNSSTATVTVSPCTGASITSQPADTQIQPNQTATLTVAGAGTGTLSYQWFQGGSGDLSTPAPGFNTGASYTTPALGATTQYWVRVSNACNTVNSRTVTVLVGSSCVPVTITQQPANLQVSSGSPATFTVGVSGTSPNFQWYLGTSGVTSTPVGTNASSFTTGPLTSDTSVWVSVSNACTAPIASATATASISTACTAPIAFAPLLVPSGIGYDVQWTGAGTQFEVQESSSPDMSGATTRTVAGLSSSFSHSVSGSPANFYYRVRSIGSCPTGPSPYSPVAHTIINPVPPPGVPALEGLDMAVPLGTTQPVKHTFLLVPPAGVSSTTFTATSDVPFMSVSPSSGTVTTSGVVITVTVDLANLPVGSNSGTVNVTFGSAKGETNASSVVALGNTGISVPVSTSLVTAAAPVAKSAGPPDNALIIPAVAHANGIGAQFVSDVRITNTSGQPITYSLTYTPSNTNGTQVGNKTDLTIKPGATTALDDVLEHWFGIGANGDSAKGVLEIRPQNFAGKTGADAATAYATVASSRTYAKTPNGTLGQFIPAIPFKNFIGKFVGGSSKPQVISLQQVSQSANFRTNLGLVEGSGQPAALSISVFNDAGTKVGEFAESLQPGEHKQLDQYLASKGVALEDGRIEVKVTSDTGRITAYASVIDNATSDPLLVAPATLSDISSNKYVIAGVADLKNSLASWRSDMRIFNSSTSAVQATLTFYPQGNPGGPVAKTITINGGETRVLNDLLASTFGITAAATGAVHVQTANPTALVVTARTYDQRTSGTYGQFIPAVTPAEAVGISDRSLNILQLEQSDRFRSNIGLAEVSGQSVTVQLTAIVPNTAAAPIVTVTLAPNEFRQLGNLLNTMGLSTAYNSRINVKVISGSGRVTAYGSVIDNLTQDPTFVPAQ